MRSGKPDPSPRVSFDRADDASITRRLTASDITNTEANSGSGAGLVTQFQFGFEQEARPIPLFGDHVAGPLLLVSLMLVLALLISRRASG